LFNNIYEAGERAKDLIEVTKIAVCVRYIEGLKGKLRVYFNIGLDFEE
jgi:hypothetical protein